MPRQPPRNRKTARPARGRGLGGEHIEGRQAVLELLRSRKRRTHEVLISGDVEPSPQLAEIEALARKGHVPVVIVGRRRFEMEARTEAPQGVIARCEELPEADLDELSSSKSTKAPFLVLLDGITDPHNLGAILRNAECAGATGVVLCRHRAAHVTPAAAKVAAGAIEHLSLALCPGVPSALMQISENGVTTIGLDGSAKTSLYDLGNELVRPVALVLGAEGRGLSSLTKRRCDMLARIPQFGRLASLNVGSASALACFEVARRRLA